jgi:segregation and condensation protein A
VLTDIKRQESVHQVEKIQATIEQQTTFVLNRLRREGRSSFKDLCRGLNKRLKVVVTFLAILEMLKEHQIALYVEDNDPKQFYLDLKGIEEIMNPENKKQEQTN